MRKLVVGMFVTLDGVMQAPGGPNEDREGDFQHGGWLVPYFDEKFGESMGEWTKRAGALLLGRKTYEMFAGSWPNSSDPAEALNILPKFVASRTLDRVTWNNSTLLKGDVAEEVAKLKAQEGGEIQVTAAATSCKLYFSTILSIPCGFGNFLLFLVRVSVCLGKALVPRSFRLVDMQLNTTGAVLHVYERMGGLKYGEVEVGQETVIFDAEA